jgi:hypothetical protein
MNELALTMAILDSVFKLFTAIGVCVIAIKMKRK